MRSMAIMCILFMYMIVASLNCVGSEYISGLWFAEDYVRAGFCLLAIKTN